jgi:acyl-coenzyme A synthetase/AMP-(fatty) acid ligase
VLSSRRGRNDRLIEKESAMTPMNALFHRATTQPNGTAFIHDDVMWTYRDLLTGAEQLSRAFLARGVRPGDRVVLHMPNSPEMAVSVYACFRVGAIACPTNLRFKTAELRDVLQRLQPALYLGDEQLYSYVETIEPGILAEDRRFVMGTSSAYKGARPWSALLAGAASAGPLPPDSHNDAPAILLTTSGTTGGAQVRHPYAGDAIGARECVRRYRSRIRADRAQRVPDGAWPRPLYLSALSELRRPHGHGGPLRSGCGAGPDRITWMHMDARPAVYV